MPTPSKQWKLNENFQIKALVPVFDVEQGEAVRSASNVVPERTARSRMNAYPLVFDCREVVVGETFAVTIDVTGRALLELDGDEWIVSGVDPGGFAGLGDTPKEAYDDFRLGLKSILFDCAASHPKKFDSFFSTVRSFGQTKNSSVEARWEAARNEMKRAQELTEPFAASLPRRTNAIHSSVRITRLDPPSRELAEKTNVMMANDNLAAAA